MVWAARTRVVPKSRIVSGCGMWSLQAKLRRVVGMGAGRQNVPWSYLLSSGLWMAGVSCPSACQPGVFRTCYIPFIK